MNASIINIGDELLIGQVINTNAARMSQMLTAAGINVSNVFTIGDDAHDIKSYLKLGLQTADIVLITGGLGPTKDDITKTTLCDFFGSELYENEIALGSVAAEELGANIGDKVLLTLNGEEKEYIVKKLEEYIASFLTPKRVKY